MLYGSENLIRLSEQKAGNQTGVNHSSDREEGGVLGGGEHCQCLIWKMGCPKLGGPV